MVRKIDHSYESFIDHGLLLICEKCIPWCVRHSIHPNDITLFRSTLLPWVMYLVLCTRQWLLPILLLWCFYFLDCVDGHLARSTHQVTVVGDYLDHIVDLWALLLFFNILLMVSYPGKIFLLLCNLFLFLSSIVHITCQQILYSQHNTHETLDILKPWVIRMFDITTPEKCRQIILITKWFCSSGMLFVYITISIIWIQQTKSKPT